jgi:hypothetical protein
MESILLEVREHPVRREYEILMLSKFRCTWSLLWVTEGDIQEDDLKKSRIISHGKTLPPEIIR